MKPDSTLADLLVWVALLCLLALTVATSFIPMGSFNLVVNLAVAAAKALLVAVFFMRVWRNGTVVKFIAAAGFIWLSFLGVLSFNDFWARGGFDPGRPGHTPRIESPGPSALPSRH